MLPVVVPSTQPAQQGLASGGTSSPSMIAKNLNAFLASLGVKPAIGNRPQSTATTMSVVSAGMQPANRMLSLPTAPATDVERIVRNTETGTPRYIELSHSSSSASQPVIASASGAAMAAKAFIASNAQLLKLNDPARELVLKETRTDELQRTSCKFTQTYQGVEVWGREFIVHFDARGRLATANGTIEQTPAQLPDVTGTIGADEAIERSRSIINATNRMLPVPQTAAAILEYTGPTAKKVIWVDESHVPHLAWVVETRSGLSQDWFTFIDAHTGVVLNRYNAVCFDGVVSSSGMDLNNVQRSFKTHQIGTNYVMIDASQPMYNAAQSALPDSPVGAIVSLDLKNADLSSSSSIYYIGGPTNSWLDKSSVSAHYNAAVTYRYFLDAHNRNSVDDKGMTIYSIVHVSEDGKPMENAYWSGKLMCYGDGNTYFYPLAGGLDVAAHEMTHGVTQFSANLEYQGQSGALNESMSDAFGTLVDTLNWKMGEQIVKNLQSYPSGALRNLSDPHNGVVKGQSSWQPARMSEYVTSTEDNGGVHLNSGIPNRAFYLTATSLGRQKAGKIWYRALTTYLTRSSQFLDARLATVKSAEDLYGAASSEVTSVKNAWDAVEVFDGTTPPPPPVSTLSGAEWILLVNTDAADPNSIYMAKTTITANSDFHPLSTTPVLSRPAVSDVSGIILFIDKSNNLRALYADPANPQEQLIDNSGVWESVSIGPGFGAVALTSKFIDTTIYYIDLVKNIQSDFKITTKAFDAADTKTALYAEALSFDPTGRYLLFDAYNEVTNASGSKISFWNINILDVSTGKTGIVFPPLADNLSVGNPSFSKTVGTRFAFDFVNEKTGQSTVMAADFNTGDVATVSGPQAVVGYPSYSIDDKAIAFHSSEIVSAVTRHSIEQMPLKENSIEGTGAKKSYVLDATYPTWFVVGKRTTGVSANSDAPGVPASFELLQNYPNPFNPTTTIRYALSEASHVVLSVYDMLGSRIAVLVNETKTAGTHRVTWNGTDESGRHVASGAYLVRIDAGTQRQTRRMMLL
ncbi:MAG TPA: M4 family metallopeptidase, partial [Bacteroidota bacterium]|nr:M4 family metallopeptidase [Bacteroidota bacterium]